MSDKIKLLLVEDENTLAFIIKDVLSEHNFDVKIASDGEQALKLLDEEQPDIVVTDIMMPTMDGFTFAQHLRERAPRLPVIFLSARSSADDVVRGFELGAKDYLRKPFAMSELIVRIRSVLGQGAADREEEKRKIYQIGKFRFDPTQRRLDSKAERQILSGRESELLHYFARNKGSLIKTDEVLNEIWGDDGYFNLRSLHVYITKLRKRLLADSSISIVNVRGEGYKMLEL